MTHTTGDAGLAKLRRKVRNLYREYIALCVFFHGIGSDERLQVMETLANIGTLKMRELREVHATLRKRNEQIASDYGLRVPVSEIVELIERAEEADAGNLLLVSKGLVQSLCSRYDRSLADFKTLPEHALIAIDPGRYRKTGGTIEIHLLEAMLFENMCALFNLWDQHHSLAALAAASKAAIKLERSLAHATKTSAFCFVEAYVNGLAIDYYFKNRQGLDDGTRITLTEWDHVKNRERFVSFRDKLLKYPRIVAGLAHPPLQESNCPEFAFLTGEARLHRDSIVHPSARPDPAEVDAPRIRAFLDRAAPGVEKVVDAAIGLVRRIETATKGNDVALTWLHDRGVDGRFSEDVFS